MREVYRDSETARVINKLTQIFKTLLANSSILRFVAKEGFFAKVWRHSGFYLLLNKIFNTPSQLLRKLYCRAEHVFLDSLVFIYLRKVLKRFEVLVGLGLAAMIIVPDSRWHNIYSTVFIIILAFLFFVKTVIEDNESFKVKVFNFPFTVFIVSILLAMTTSLFPRVSFNYFVLYAASFLIVLIIVSSVKSVREINQLLEILLVGVVVTALYGLWQWKVVGIPVDPSMVDIRLNPGMGGRLYSTMGNPNVYGELLVLTMPFFLAMILNAKTYARKIVYTLFILPPLAALLLTGTRSAWISFFGSILVFVFFKKKKLIPVILILGIICLPYLPAPIYRRIMSIVQFNDSSASYRKLIYESAVNMLQDFWVTGVGLGTDVFLNIFKRYAHPALKTVAHTHNFYLQLWLESGLIAVLSFIWFLAGVVKNSIISIAKKADSQVNNILIAGISSIAGIMAMGLVEHVWFYNRILVVFWVVIGVMLACINIAQNESF